MVFVTPGSVQNLEQEQTNSIIDYTLGPPVNSQAAAVKSLAEDLKRTSELYACEIEAQHVEYISTSKAENLGESFSSDIELQETFFPETIDVEQTIDFSVLNSTSSILDFETPFLPFVEHIFGTNNITH